MALLLKIIQFIECMIFYIFLIEICSEDFYKFITLMKMKKGDLYAPFINYSIIILLKINLIFPVVFNFQ